MSSFAGAMVCADGPGGISLLCRRRDPTLPDIGQYERVEPSDRSQPWDRHPELHRAALVPSPSAWLLSSRTVTTKMETKGRRMTKRTGRQVRPVPKTAPLLGYYTIDLYG